MTYPRTLVFRIPIFSKCTLVFYISKVRLCSILNMVFTGAD